MTANIKAAGCAAKISAAQLSEIVQGLPEFKNANLLTDIGTFEDAAVYKLSDDLAIIQTIDFFPPVLDDPFLYGKIAATNALSDVYAMGGQPLLALNVLCFPVCDYPLEIAQRIVGGGAQAVMEAGALLVGGHSIQGPEPLFGLSVTGTVHPDKILTNGGAQGGDAILVTKAIGTGACLLALKGGVLDDDARDYLIASLTLSNGKALELARKYTIHAASDVTGFGLIGHLHEMSKAAGLKVRLFANKIPYLPQALSCAEQGLVPAGAYANRKSYESVTNVAQSIDLSISDLLFDPQTSGGLLLSLPFDEAPRLETALRQAGHDCGLIGVFENGEAGHVEVIENQ